MISAYHEIKDMKFLIMTYVVVGIRLFDEENQENVHCFHLHIFNKKAWECENQQAEVWKY